MDAALVTAAASLVVALLSGAFGFVTRRAGQRAEAAAKAKERETAETSNRILFEQEAFQRARKFDVDTIHAQAGEIRDLQAELRDVKHQGREHEREIRELHHELDLTRRELAETKQELAETKRRLTVATDLPRPR